MPFFVTLVEDQILSGSSTVAHTHVFLPHWIDQLIAHVCGEMYGLNRRNEDAVIRSAKSHFFDAALIQIYLVCGVFVSDLFLTSLDPSL